jgi:hypothetical protein
VTGPLESLHSCKQDGEPFVLLSHDIVFDVSQERIVDEGSFVNPVCEAGKMLEVAEAAVLNYESGYVLRVGDRLEDILDVFDTLESCPRRFSNRIIHPVCRECVDYLAETLPTLVPAGSRPKERVLHAVSFIGVDVANILLHKFGISDYEISDDAPPVLPPKNLHFFAGRISNLLSLEDFAAYVRANQENCKRRLFR